MCVAAHPDDEDGATLTILRRKYGVHTVTVFSTYGEGGQNVVGPELYEELGAIRARETEEAAQVQGSEPYFLGLRDFGFSKSADEAFRVWGHDEALRRMVLKIRQLRPDVIITNHDTVTGHGHHQATGRLVLEAFDAAADPQRFPEQLKNGVTTWQVKRLFVRFQFEGSGSKQAEEEATSTGRIVAINPNERDEIRGTTYAEQALQALQHHATQGPWPKTLPAGGRPVIRYRLAREAKDVAPLPSNAQTVLEGLRLPQATEETLSPQAAKALLPLYSDKSRQNILAALINARKNGLFAAHATTNDQPRFSLMRARLDNALATASGINTMLLLSNKVLIPGTTTKVSLNITNNGASAARIQSINLHGLQQAGKASLPKTLAPGERFTIELKNSTPPTASITAPAAEHLYDGELFGEELDASANVEIDGATFPVEAKMQIDVAPAVEILSVTPSPIVLVGNKDVSLKVKLLNHLPEQYHGRVMVKGVSGIDHQLGDAFQLASGESRTVAGSFQDLTFPKVISNSLIAPSSAIIRVAVSGDGDKDISGKSAATGREVKVIYADARVAPNLRVGYLPSFDATLQHSLAALGVEAKELTVDDVRAGDLSSYQTIIIDNRGYQAHPELIAANSRLMDYVQNGGTLIVFYHKNNEWNPDTQRNRPQLAPYPIVLGGLRVTDENAPIEFTEPQNPLLNYPNKITQEDFKGWIQERGLYYPQTWDSHYSAPLSMSDPAEQPLRGGLLVADYGRGHYIYTSLVWYRQLRAGIPGAYRFLANMISYEHEGKR
jgi:LmbE family N-acetylglucosaminyl deacetylase